MRGFLEDAFDDLTKPKTPVVSVSGPYYGQGGVQQTRKNPVTGLTQIIVPDPDNPGRTIWVDAIRNPSRDLMVPVDSRYGAAFPQGKYFPFLNQFAGSENEIDFSGPLSLSVPGSSPLQMTVPGAFAAQDASQNASDGGGWLLIAGVLLVVYLMSR